MTRAYYNEIDPKAAAWLRELIKRGLIADGEVDTRSIVDVRSNDLHGFAQCHFFAGIGGWSYALRQSGFDDSRSVWTGSCPCQPFSCAGKQKGTADERHLWPVFANLIRECRPVRIFGEQVANAIGAGWLDGVRSDLEAEGYTVGAAVLGAHSVGAPHIRQRLYWVASDYKRERREGRIERQDSCKFGQWSWRGKEDLQSIQESPMLGNDRWPQPIIRTMDDGLRTRMDGCHGAGNAIVPQVAKVFIEACEDCLMAQPVAAGREVEQ